MIIKQRMPLIEKILLTIVMIILTVGVVGMSVATFWLSRHFN